METRTYQVYKFNEASAELKKKIIEKYYDINVDHEWWDAIYCHYKSERLPALGYEDADINFSGFASQGDGASFTARIDLPKYLKAHKLKSKYPHLAKMENEDVGFIIKRTDSQYSHENTCRAIYETLYSGVKDEVINEAEELVKYIEKERYDLCNDIYSDLEKDYDYLISEEAVIETLEANEYDFDEDGKID